MRPLPRQESGAHANAVLGQVADDVDDPEVELEDEVVALHPYKVPEFLIVTVDGGSKNYLKWVEAVTRS